MCATCFHNRYITEGERQREERESAGEGEPVAAFLCALPTSTINIRESERERKRERGREREPVAALLCSLAASTINIRERVREREEREREVRK